MEKQFQPLRKGWRTYFVLLFLWLAGATVGGSAQTGALDPNFSPRVENLAGGVRTTVVQANGKVIVGGRFEIVNGVPRANLARLNADGSVDPSFSPSVNDAVNVVAFDQNGKILIGGEFDFVNGTTRHKIARLNPDGSLDAAFDPGDGPQDTVAPFISVAVNAIVPLADGTYYAGGRFNRFDQSDRPGFLRLTATGAVDPGYIPGRGLDDVRAIAPLPDGSVIFVGASFIPSRIVKLDPTGTGVPSFNEATPLNSSPPLAQILDLAVQPDGKIVVGGFFFFQDGGQSFRALARLNDDGTTDLSFTPAISLEGFVYRLSRTSDGDFLVAGNFTAFGGTSRNNIARLDCGGGLDTDFNPGDGTNGTVAALATLPDGRIVIGGEFTAANGEVHINLARLGENGAVENGFRPDVGARTLTGVRATTVQPDGKILVAGQFQKVNGQLRTNIARLNADGTLDSTFNPTASIDNGDANELVIQPDGKILVGGFFDGVNGAPSRNIARLNADGTTDATFQVGNGPNDRVNAIGLQSDGRIVIGGLFTTIDDQQQSNLGRLTSAGVYDSTFISFLNAEVTALAVQSDDRVALATLSGGGNNRPVKSTPEKGKGKVVPNSFGGGNVLRVNADGTEDLSFTVTQTDGRVADMGLQASGKAIIGGEFATLDGATANGIARLNTDGAPDATFTAGQGAGGAVFALLIRPDQAIFIGGAFSSFDGTTRNRVARLTADGALDTGFDAGDGPDDNVLALGLQDDGQVFIGGAFSTVSGQTRYCLARLGAVQSCSFTISPESDTANAAGGTLTVTIAGDAGCPWTVTGTIPDWVSVAPLSGSGNGSVSLTVSPNYSGAPRNAAFVIAGRPYALTQTAAELVNQQVSLTILGQSVLPNTCPGYAADYVIDARLTNTSGQTVAIPHFQVVELREANGTPPALPFRLISADGATCGSGGTVGAIQSTDGTDVPATLPTLAPGQSANVRFRVAVPTLRRFRFVLNVLGVPGGGQSFRRRIGAEL